MKIFDLNSEMHLSLRRKNIFAFFIIFVIVLSVYSNTFDASWHFDDGPNIVQNEALHLTHLNWQDIKKTFFASWGGGGKLYRPAACLSFALNYYFGGTQVFGYHLINLTVHFLSSLFLFLFIRNTLNLPLLKTRYGPNAYSIALLATVLWAISPIQTEAVTYVVQRMTSMAGMFYIMALYFYLKGNTAQQKKVKIAHFVLCLFCGVLAIGSKENAIMLLPSIFLFDLLLIKGATVRNLKRYSFLLLIMVIVILIAVLLIERSFILDPEKIFLGYNIRGFTLLERLLTEPYIVLFYMSLLLYPIPSRFCFAHDISLSRGLVDPPTTLIAILIIFMLLGLALWKAKRWPLISFCILFFFMNHAIESTVLPLELAFEHRNYTPSMLFFVPLSILFVKGIKFFSGKVSMQIIIAASVVLVLIASGNSTFIRNFVWKTDETLWIDAVLKSPNLPRTHHNLGKYYDDIGLKRVALEHYQKALKLPEGPNRRSHYIVSYNIGIICKSLKENDTARRYLLKSVELEPRFSPAYTSLGIMSIEKGQNGNALDYFIKALTHDINSDKARNYAALALLRQNRIEDAIGQFKKGLEADPNDLYALTHVGVAYKYIGEFNKAAAYLKKAIRIDPRYVTAFFHLIEVYSLKGETEKAYQTAVELLEQFPYEAIPILIDRRIIKTEPLLEPADVQNISPVLEEALMKKGVQYHALARKLKNHRTRKSEQHNRNLPLQSHPFTVHGK